MATKDENLFLVGAEDGSMLGTRAWHFITIKRFLFPTNIVARNVKLPNFVSWHDSVIFVVFDTAVHNVAVSTDPGKRVPGSRFRQFFAFLL